MNYTLWTTQSYSKYLQASCPFQCTLLYLSFPTRYSSISAIYNKAILDSHCLSFEPSLWQPWHSNGIFSYQPAYQIKISMMDKSAWADALECRLLLSINMLPGDCVLLGCMTLWGPFGGPAELQWLQSVKVTFRHWSPSRNLCFPGRAQFISPSVSPACCALCKEQSHFHPLSLEICCPLSPRCPLKWMRAAWLCDEEYFWRAVLWKRQLKI